MPGGGCLCRGFVEIPTNCLHFVDFFLSTKCRHFIEISTSVIFETIKDYVREQGLCLRANLFLSEPGGPAGGRTGNQRQQLPQDWHPHTDNA